jgi:small subunit ribosomal protein S6
MPLYESVFIARQDVSAQQVEGIADAMTSVLEQGGGKVAKREYWGLRKLAYRVKKNRKGHYVQLDIEAPAEALHEMERQIRLHEDILRYMTVRVDALDPEPSVIMANKDKREERPRREGRDDNRYGNDRQAAPADEQEAASEAPDASEEKTEGETE